MKRSIRQIESPDLQCNRPETSTYSRSLDGPWEYPNLIQAINLQQACRRTHLLQAVPIQGEQLRQQQQRHLGQLLFQQERRRSQEEQLWLLPRQGLREPSFHLRSGAQCSGGDQRGARLGGLVLQQQRRGKQQQVGRGRQKQQQQLLLQTPF